MNAEFAKRALSIPGLFIECGVGKGLYTATITNYLDFKNTDRKFYLLDTFSGIPLDQLNDSEKNMALRFNNSAYAGNYFNEVKETFSQIKNVHLIAGLLPDSLSEVPFADEGISYLQIDLNNAFADSSVLRKLFPYVTNGGIIIIDDYAYSDEFQKTRNSVDIVAQEMNFTVIALPTGQGLILK